MSYLEGKRGDTNNYTGTVLDSAGDAVDLTGATLRFTAKLNRGDADNATGVIAKTTGSGITHTNAATGQYRITLAPADTSSLTATTLYFWDLQLTDGAGSVFTVDNGTLTITTDVGVTAP
jgi:hypothetical protein